MTNPTLPLTDQLPNGREQSAWSCEERDPKNCRNAYGCHCAEITALVHKRDEACAQLAALNGDRVAKLQSRIAELEALVYVPGRWKCAKCNFGLMQIEIRASDGAFRAQDQPGENCPNCDVPLWRVTEREAGNESVDRLSEMGDPRGYAAGFAAGLEAAIKWVNEEPELPGPIPAEVACLPIETVARAAVRSTKKNIAANLRALRTPPNPVPGLEARVRKLELLAGKLLAKHINQLRLRSLSVDDDKTVIEARAALAECGAVLEPLPAPPVIAVERDDG